MMTKDFEEIPYSDSSRLELKRSHQWLTEPSGSQLLGNKRQLVEIGAAWDNSLVPSQLTNCLFDPAIAHTSSHLLGQQHIEAEQCNNVVSSIGFPSVHGSTLNLDTIRKVKVNQLYGGSSETGQFAGNFSNKGVGVTPMGDNFVLMGQSLQKADCNIFSMSSSSYTKGQENFMSLLSRDRVPENVFMTGPNCCKENTNVLSGGQSIYTQGGDMASMVSCQGRADETNDQIYHEERSQTVSFGGYYQKETTLGSSVRVINSFENFSHDPATAKVPLYMEAEENMSFEFGNPLYASPRVDTLLVPKTHVSKTAKKGSTNTFPSNVKSLLSTGMFDGVTVKYYSWSREKNLKGIIKGTGYLCGCSNCNFNKVLNAYEFEQHANCKTKHPNNHIYFENGKTIYGVVQELKNSPQEKLFKETTLGSSVRVINSFENFSHDPATAKVPLYMEAEENMSFEFGNPLYASPRVDTLLVPKTHVSKTAKKGSTNTFPSNVKSLLSTGMFDGVTVKYYSWSREKNLKGIIKGTGYLCGCSNCNFNKVLNAYEFEQHANCKTKHPNNHIYFENGKTIYGVVQELKNSPQEKLFDAIQNVTGSDINHKNFNIWKASYQVASLELKRIYGKDAATLAS
ncbi:PREDICTED: uncharacterized protein LOC104769586 [Camelina sativa]|uniref:Uncharacterized protein LOC104769586 n=1 Tax=Camelina sativa TaxID=90675 RepID=A0ABM1RE84_CAMSA|nr:PREDICTED: uncharacterized protein LOC104769586 [Camelina sativa]